MEALIILLGEFLLAPVFVGLSALWACVSFIVSLFLELLFGRRRKSKKEPVTASVQLPPRFVKWFFRITLGILSLFLVALLLLNFVFLEATLRWVTDKVEAKSDMRIRYELIEGNLFTGRFTFGDLQVEPSGTDKSLKVEANLLDADLPITRLLIGKREIESFKLTDAKIEYHHSKRTPVEPEQRASGISINVGTGNEQDRGFAVSKRPTLLDAPRYKISDLQTERVAIKVVDTSGTPPKVYDLEIKDMHAAPLRSHFAVFDALFRTNLNATLNGSELVIVNTQSNGKRLTSLSTSNVQADVLASLVGGPFSLFESGSVDVEVKDEWEVEQIDNLSLGSVHEFFKHMNAATI